MKTEKIEILDIIRSVDVITVDFYEELISKYDKKDVDFIIDSQIDDRDYLKYADYIDMKLSDFEKDVDYYDSYKYDLQRYKKFKNDDNKKYTSLLCKVKDKLKKIYESYGYEFNMSFLSNLEKGVVSFSSRDLIMIKDLCLEYIYLRNKLIEGNLSLVPAMARPYFNEDNNRLEMIQNGNDGLMTAVFNYDSSVGSKFSTFACFWIKGRIIDGLKRSSSIFSVPSYIINQNIARIKAIEYLTNKLERTPLDYEVAEYLNISLSKLHQIEIAFREPYLLSDIVHLEDDDLNDMDVLIDNEIDLLKPIADKELKIEILVMMKKYLSELEYNVLTNRYGLDGKARISAAELAKKLNFTRSYISAIEKKALKKMRSNCENLSVYL